MDNNERDIQDTTSAAEKDRLENMSIAVQEECSREHCKRTYLNTDKGCNVFTKWCPVCAEEIRSQVHREETADQ
jgi:hypothetical protein